MFSSSMPPWILVDISDHLQQPRCGFDLLLFQLEFKHLAIFLMVFVVSFCIPVEEQCEIFIDASVGILPDADEKMDFAI